jgi:hypothetical protein
MLAKTMLMAMTKILFMAFPAVTGGWGRPKAITRMSLILIQ